MIKIVAAIMIVSFSSFGQDGKLDCKKALKKTPYFARHDFDVQHDSFKMDVEILMNCGDLDSIDIQLLNGSMIAALMIELTHDEQEITYNTIINSINELKRTDDYSKFREAILAYQMLENKLVTVEDFENDMELLFKIGMSSLELENFQAFILTNTEENLTYREALVRFKIAEVNSKPAPPEKVDFIQLTDLESAIKQGEEDGKKVLLFFSAHNCINALKVEQNILTDDEVKLLMHEKFTCFIADVDDRTLDKVTNRAIGEKFLKLQIDNFKITVQPYFCIIDGNGNVLSDIGETKSPEEFIEFLNKGLD